MKRKQNVIIFSAGESVKNGTVDYIKEQLQKKSINCLDYRFLFDNAHNKTEIALLPTLLKKIPTFDFALIIADGVDKIKLRGNLELTSMRDNVIFEIGLCVMALGTERVIVLADKDVRMPEDLLAAGKIGVEYITFDSCRIGDTVNKLEKIIDNRSGLLQQKFASPIQDIIKHIGINSDLISPVFIGASVSSAESYFMNFIIRLLVNSDNYFSLKANPKESYRFPEDFKIKILVPTTIDLMTGSKIVEYYIKNGYKEYAIYEAGTRGMFFYGDFDIIANELLIVDIPTSITASYEVVKSVLNIDSDEDYDMQAEKRFITKELDMYTFALTKLLSYDVAESRLSFISSAAKRQQVLQKLNDITICSVNIDN